MFTVNCQFQLHERLADVPGSSVSCDWFGDGQMTQFKPMRAELGIFAETVGRETLFFTGTSKLGMCKFVAAKGHLCYLLGKACLSMKPNTEKIQAKRQEREIF